MRRVALLAIVLVAAGCADAVAPPGAGITPHLAKAGSGEAIPGQYIVVFKDAVGDAETLSKGKVGTHAGKLKHAYKSVLKGFAAELSDEAVAALAADPDVAYIEVDQVVTADVTQTGATWGIDRIDQRNRPLSGTYTYNASSTAQSAVRAYIIDTGIYTSHSQFGGRASNVYDAFGGSGADCNGHGTHVAGTVGSSTYGVAKFVKLRGVRVLNCSGSGSSSGVIAGMDWVRTNHIKPAVANMSLGGGFSTASNTAANNLANAGVFLAVAAGNSNANACNYSPSSAANATTVASSTSSDAKSSFSNYGSCVDLYAPGSSITSTWLNGGTNTISGTSMASPHVAGVGALYKAVFGDASSATVNSWIVNNATLNVITGNPSGTPNRLLYKSTL